MKTLDRYLLRQFIPVFLAGLFFFVLLLELIDIFTNLVRYLAYEASIIDIAKVAVYYIPKCVSYAAPVSLLFAVSYILGDLYSKNELIVVFASGMPLRRLSLGFVIVGVLLSIGSFFFEDQVVIASIVKKNQLSRTLLRQQNIGNEADVVVKAKAGRVVYSVDYYNDIDKSINGVNIVLRDQAGNFNGLIYSRRASWSGAAWVFTNAVVYRWEGGMLLSEPYNNEGEFTEPPETFKRNSMLVEEMVVKEAALFIADLKEAGLPFNGALADYYKRYAFAATPLVVIILSIALGGRFRKNILLMSLLTSLISSVIYYVAQMITMIFAKLGYIIPVLGAWTPTAIFIVLGTILVLNART